MYVLYVLIYYVPVWRYHKRWSY